MSLYRLLKLLTCLPTAEKAGLSTHTTEEANKAVEEVLASQHNFGICEGKQEENVYNKLHS